METFSALLAICAGNSPVPGEVPTQRPVTRGFHVFFDLRPNKPFSKQSWGWLFEALSRPLWRHYNANMVFTQRNTTSFDYTMFKIMFLIKTSNSPTSINNPQKRHDFTLPLFRVRSWNNGVCCMSFYILTICNPQRHDWHYADDSFKWIFLNRDYCILIKISLMSFLRVQLTIILHWFR